jgi:hypothetical protein
MVFENDLEGKAIIELPEDSPAVRAVYTILDGFAIG